MRRLSRWLPFRLLAIGLFALLPPSLIAQNEPRNQGGLDETVPTPRLSPSTPGTQDPNALAEIRAYVNATGLATWTGMQASGTTTYIDAPGKLVTTLSMLPGNRTKLVVTSSKGDSVTTTNVAHGHVQYAGGTSSRLPALAVVGGIVSFDLPSFVAQSPSAYTVIDDGTIKLDGVPFHRITIELDIVEREAGTGSDARAAVDLYFDPSTHLLCKSATIFQLSNTGRHRFVRVLTYGSYAASGPMRIPTSISETLDGQATWTLNLTSFTTTTPPANSIF